ncbi:lytic transglycosylase domain-containing protein [Bacteroides sp. 51]|uniref:lytic transglycosylase domain-containing protein n=1 Tax=Bacteroides sp. 51 TaxID=2302938 RepID=UPI0013D846AC|nr:lytic transglycosylase domain-containing protein [Bacteroides sp. 51]NDV80968.1 lytic transglycosylase domain-containing protein [Bacteroides sp. 51]
MKKNKTHILITLLIAVIIGATTPFLFSNTEVDENHSAKSQVPYCVSPPIVPQEATFAGQKVDLERYDLRERMDREMMAFTYMHSTTMLLVKRANRFFPVVEPILKENNIPDDFKYLMVIESNLNTLARSHAGAAGLWQFMQATGREKGLEVNNNIDERYHVEKSTRAACKYLKESYNRYGDWLTVAAAYNAGNGRISGELNKQLATRAVDLWLVEETSRYMFRIMAAKLVLQDPQAYGFLIKKEQLYPPLPYKELKVTTGIDDLAKFAKENGVSYAQLKDANPWLRSTSLENKSGRTYTLKILDQDGMNYNPKKINPHYKKWVID